MARAKTAPPHVLHGLPVLAADDNETNRRLFHTMLTSWGTTPTVVDGGQAALAVLEQARAAGAPFRLVLLDARMPDLGGFAVAERIRDDPSLAGVTIMLLTSDRRPGGAQKTKAGRKVELPSPADPHALEDGCPVCRGGNPALPRPLARNSVLVRIDRRRRPRHPSRQRSRHVPRLRAARPVLGIIALRLLDADGSRRAALAAGADEFVPKSALITERIPAIRRAVEASRLREVAVGTRYTGDERSQP